LFANLIYISSIKALLDLLKNAVFLYSKFLEEDIVKININLEKKFSIRQFIK